MRGARTILAGAAATLLVAACATGGGASRSHEARPAHSARARGTVLREAELVEANQPLLDLLRHKLPGMQVREIPGTCPDVTLRGRSTVTTSSAPAIYLDGTRTANNCILRELGTGGLGLVEIYPSGVPARPGYRNSPYGVILIFMRGPSVPAPLGDSLLYRKAGQRRDAGR